jgi:glucosamine-6-phosphate deaminase
VEATITANSRNFDSIDDVPKTAISMGIGSILKAKKIILFAYGANKADAIYKTIEEMPTTDVPASALQNHPDVTIILDEAAASKLTK